MFFKKMLIKTKIENIYLFVYISFNKQTNKNPSVFVIFNNLELNFFMLAFEYANVQSRLPTNKGIASKLLC